MDVPDQYCEYLCSGYFSDGWSDLGHFDDESQLLVIAPLAETYEARDLGFFAVGRSGVGGIDFGYRRRMAGLWAYYPIDGEFCLVASTVSELVERWRSGAIIV